MLRYAKVATIVLLSSWGALAQVGIGTANISPSALLQLESTQAAFVLPRMTDSQMSAIAAPETGSMIFNNSENLPYFRGSAGWSGFDINSNPTVILLKSGGSIATSTSSAYAIGVSAANTQSISSAYFTVNAPGTVTVSRAGVYLMSVSLSVTNMPAGSRNYYLAVYKNGSLISYLSKSKLENATQDYWGMTGTLMYYADAGDQFSFKYFIANSTSLSAVFQSICITKLN